MPLIHHGQGVYFLWNFSYLLSGNSQRKVGSVAKVLWGLCLLCSPDLSIWAFEIVFIDVLIWTRRSNLLPVEIWDLGNLGAWYELYQIGKFTCFKFHGGQVLLRKHLWSKKLLCMQGTINFGITKFYPKLLRYWFFCNLKYQLFYYCLLLHFTFF